VIALYEFPVSPFCEKVRRILHVKGIPYRTEKVPLMATRGWYRRINPASKVPVIVHEGRVVSDSTTIAHYLERAFPTPALLPKDPAARALCHVLEDWADESLYFYQKRLKFALEEDARTWTPRFSAFDSRAGRALLSLVLVRYQERQLHAQGVGRKSQGAVIEDVTRHVAAVDAMAQRSAWLVGDDLSLADIAIVSQLSGIRATSRGAAIVAEFPHVVAWMNRVDEATAAPRQASAARRTAEHHDEPRTEACA
jgi:glutathione S-transferase